MCVTHNPLECILPPYILDRIIEKGNAKQRLAALKAMKISGQLRLQRNDSQENPRPVRKAMVSGISAHSPERVRRVYDAQSMEELPGVLVRNEGDGPTGDAAVDEAYDGGGATWDLYWEVYGRNSIDDEGMPIDQTVHYGDAYNNAFWNGEQMAYGDGDGELFQRFTMDMDVIGHELSHGVIQHSGGLIYWYQSGALNESFADVFGTLVRQREMNQDVTQADWLLGQNSLIGNDFALRSLKAPGTAYTNHPVLGDDPQPATMDTYQILPPWEDNGGVHINSGIPNHAFYLAASEIGGYAWEKAGLIWYRALTERINPRATFRMAAYATIFAARDEFGWRSPEEQAVVNAWRAVKVI